MSARNCPLSLVRDCDSAAESQKHHYITLEIPLDPNDPDGLKVSQKVQKLKNTDCESVLEHVLRFDGVVHDLSLGEGAVRFNLFERLLDDGVTRNTWDTVRNDHPGHTQAIFETCIDSFILKFMTRDVSLDTKEYLRQVKKPRKWTVQQTITRLQILNNLIEYMPSPEEGEAQIPKFSDAELRVVLQNCGPKSWKDSQVKAAYRPSNLTEQTQYFEGLRQLENDGNHNPRNNTTRNANRNNGSNNNNRRNNGNNSSNGRNNNSTNRRGRNSNSSNNSSNLDPSAVCPIHGTHTVGECTLIRNERQRFQNRRATRNNGQSNNNQNDSVRNNNRQHRYNTRSGNRTTNENNNVSSNNHNNPQEDDESLDEEEMNTIYEEMNNVEEKVKPSKLLSETRVELSNKKVVLGLFDSGAGGVHIKRSTLSKIQHTVHEVCVEVKGRYSKSFINQVAQFELKLPDFCSSKTVKVKAYIDEDAIGRHDIIFGQDLIAEQGFVLDYKSKVIIWDDLVCPMRPLHSVDINNVSENRVPEDKGDDDLPDLVKDATRRVVKGIHANQYNKYNYHDMVTKCSHLSQSKKKDLLDLFKNYEELFSGNIGEIPGPPVHLELKKDARPYAAPAYSIPKALEKIARDEIQDLVNINVLIANVRSAWAAPSFFRRKKDGGVRFVSDFRKLNEQLIRRPFPQPNIDDTIWKMNGFTFATCFDLNRGYYHFVMDEESQNLCGIVLPWGSYCYRCLPQGCVVSSDIFQYRMTVIFNDFEDVIAYMDNVLLYTKLDFGHHLQRMGLVLETLKQNNLHVHVEETFLASQRIDYLGYTLTPTGIEPQVKKVLPILKFKAPTNRRQLKSFLGFVNYYKKHWRRRSHILEPLTRLTSSKVKFEWTEEQQKAFKTIKNVMAKKILLSYPDFSKPFHIYTDASDKQLGGIIVQDDKPIALYSRKLTPPQRNYTVMEKELLSIVETTEHHRNILFGFPLILHSDHKNLSFNNFNSERVRRWRLLLEEYPYEFRYTPGRENFIADMISRFDMLPVPQLDVIDMNVQEIADDVMPIDFRLVSQHQTTDAKIMDKIATNAPHYEKQNISGYNLVFYKNKVVIPDSLIMPFIRWYHETLNHPGKNRTYLTLSQYFYHRGMEALVDRFLSDCSICQEWKRPTRKYGHLPAQLVQYQPWQMHSN